MEERRNEFITYLKNVKEVSDNTLASYHQDLDKFLEYMGSQGIKEFQSVNETILNSYILYLEKNGLKSATVARNIVTLKAFFLFLVKHRYIEEDPTERLRSPKIERAPKVNLSIGEVDKLLNAPDLEKSSGKRDKAMLELLYATGMKASELVHLKMDDLNMQYNIVTCIGEKKQRVIPFGETAKTALVIYLQEAREELLKGKEHEYLFVNRQGSPLTRQGFWKLIKRYAQENGIENVTPRSLRNSFATHLIQNGANVMTVGEMLGYADNSMAYVYADDKEARVRDEYVKAHPRS